MLPILGGAAGALVTVAALSIAGVLDRGASTPEQAGYSPSGVRVTSTAPQSAITAGLSIVAIAARDDRGARRGSGVCVRHAGRILTSARVVGEATMPSTCSAATDSSTAPGSSDATATTDLVLLEVDGRGERPGRAPRGRRPGGRDHRYGSSASRGPARPISGRAADCWPRPTRSSQSRRSDDERTARNGCERGQRRGRRRIDRSGRRGRGHRPVARREERHDVRGADRRGRCDRRGAGRARLRAARLCGCLTRRHGRRAVDREDVGRWAGGARGRTCRRRRDVDRRLARSSPRTT